jgi:hypothetical protein
MKTMTRGVAHMRNRSIALAVAAACLTALPVHAQETVTVRQPASKQENIGVMTGLAVGAAAGGPVGAIERSSRPASTRAKVTVRGSRRTSLS